MTIEQIVGGLILGFGLFSIYARTVQPGLLGKQDRMKRYYGETLGTVIHVLGYTVMPLVLGTLIIMGVVHL